MDTPRRHEEHVRIIRSLADGIDPFTGQQYERDSPYQHPDVVRALMGVLHALELARARPPAERQRRRERPANSGQPWSDGEDEKLAAAFDGGTSISDLAREHERSIGAIRARLHRLGRLDEGDSGGFRFASPPPQRKPPGASTPAIPESEPTSATAG